MRLEEKYKKEVIGQLKEQFGYTNLLAIPRVTKVVLNVGVGRNNDKARIDAVTNTLAKISGQKPVATKARKSISSFKIREGMIVGVTVTLRGKRMYDFLDKLVSITLPRVRDFRGISPKSFDKQGNYSLGFKESTPFPELKAEDLDQQHGIEVSISTTAQSREEGQALLTLLGFPFIQAGK